MSSTYIINNNYYYYYYYLSHRITWTCMHAHMHIINNNNCKRV
jgi:hypothetical protein